MRSRLNESYPIFVGSSYSSDLYRRFNKQFNFLLNPENTSLRKISAEELYIHDEDIERQLYELEDDMQDRFYYLVGYTGIGKSTTIQHCFKTQLNSVPYYLERSKSLVFPAYYDAAVVSDCTVTDSITRKIKTVTDEITKLFGVRCFNNNYDFYTLIMQTKPELLQYHIEDRILRDLNEAEAAEVRLEAFQKNSSFKYELCKLKYLLNHEDTDIQNIIIILDDIESLDIENEKEIVEKFLHIYSCLKNADMILKERKYSVQLLIGGRPHTYRILREDVIFDRKFESYGSIKIYKDKVPSLLHLFKKRFKAATKYYDIITKVENKEAWQNAYEVLKLLATDLDHDFSEIITELNHFDVRKSLETYSKILGNRKWIQKNKIRTSYFNIVLDEYGITKANVIKAIACGESPVYLDTEIIPNILYNTEEIGLELLGTYILKYFMKMQRSQNSYGRYGLELADFYEKCELFFDKANVTRFKEVMKYFIKKKVILKSINEREDTELIDSGKVYLPNRGIRLWNLLGNDSVLFELYREAVYRSSKKKYNREINSKLSQDAILIDCLAYLQELLSIEQGILSIIINSGNYADYVAYFDDNLISGHIYAGIKNTIQYFYYAHNNTPAGELEEKLKAVGKDISDYISYLMTVD